MKILLISSNVVTSPYPLYPIGVSIISGALSAAGHEVRQFDYLIKNSSMDTLKREISEYGPELIGISIRNIDNVNSVNNQHYIETAQDIVKEIRSVTGSRIILGGAGFSLMPWLILEKTGADFGIAGEGESLIVDFVNNAEKGIYPEDRIISSSKRLTGSGILPAKYDDKFLEFYLHSGNMAPVQTKRGCTHKCIYCTYPLLEGSKIRRRNPGLVVDDIELLFNTHKAKYIFFVDSLFNDDEGAYIAVLKEMIRRKVNVPWTGFFTPTGLNDEIVGMMKETGLIAVEIGSDAASDTTLKRMGKRFTFRDIEECNNLLSKHEIATSHYFMFGGPGENKSTVIEGIENIKNLKKCVAFIFMGIRILPDTPLERIALRENVIAPEDSLLDSVYYFSPEIEKKWLEKTLTDSFAEIRHCVFPPDIFDNSLKMLHKMGYIGTLWDLLLPDRKPTARGWHEAKCSS